MSPGQRPGRPGRGVSRLRLDLRPEGAASHQPRATPWATGLAQTSVSAFAIALHGSPSGIARRPAFRYRRLLGAGEKVCVMDPRRAYWALAVLFAINTMNFFDRVLLGAVGEQIRKAWSLSDTALGTLGTAFIVMYAIVGLPLGRLADTVNRTRILGAGG